MEYPQVTEAVRWTELRARCAARVTDLLHHVPLPNPWDANEFLNQLERRRGREIDLCAVPWTSGDSTGAWKRNADHDLIAYAANTTSIHQDHIILHEVGHMVFDHRGQCVLSERQARRLAPHLRPAAFAHLLNTASHRIEEAEAETFATMILARVARLDRRERSRQALDESTAAALGRVTAAFDLP